MKNILTKRLLIGTLLISMLTVAISPITVTAQQTNNPTDNPPAQYTPLEPLPCIPGNEVVCTGDADGKINFQQYIQQTFNLLIALAGAAAVFMIVFGGLQYMTTDSWQGKRDGLEKARKALLGLLLVLTSFLLLRTIDPRLVAIPSTLVEPLNIDYDELATMDSFINDIMNNGGDLVAPYLRDNAQEFNALNQTVTQKEQTFADSNNFLCGYLATGLACTEENLVELCRQVDVAPNLGLTGSNVQPGNMLQNACIERERQRREILAAKADVEIAASQRSSFERARDCLSNFALGQDPSASRISDQAEQCKEDIERQRQQTGYRLAPLGEQNQEINDYAAYASAIIDMNAAVMKYNPTASDILGTITTATNVVTFPIFGASTISNGILSALTPTSFSAEDTNELISSLATDAAISDPELKGYLQEYAAALSRGIGN